MFGTSVRSIAVAPARGAGESYPELERRASRTRRHPCSHQCSPTIYQPGPLPGQVDRRLPDAPCPHRPLCYPPRDLRSGLIIAIDGPTAAGKSTAGKALAARLGYTYIDSGAMYRAVALAAVERSIALDDAEALTELAGNVEVRVGGDPHAPITTLDGRDVTSLLRTSQIDAAASKVSAVPGVRAAMVAQQQAVGRDGGVVMDGRDIGTHVFPNADLKVFLQADSRERARRRFEENQARGSGVTLDATFEAIEDRDLRDKSRDAAPLRAAGDAVVIDTTSMSREDLVDRLLELALSRL